jgi:hypothetical protein
VGICWSLKQRKRLKNTQARYSDPLWAVFGNFKLLSNCFDLWVDEVKRTAAAAKVRRGIDCIYSMVGARVTARERYGT